MILLQPVLNEDGLPTGQTETEVPFNLEVLRKHLSHVSLARRVLSEDLAARQKLLEDSVYDVAVQRMRRKAELFKELGIGDSALKKPDLQLWMWQWHQLLQNRLKEDIALLIREEAGRFIQPDPNIELSYAIQFLPGLITRGSFSCLDPSCHLSSLKNSPSLLSLKSCIYKAQVASQMA